MNDPQLVKLRNNYHHQICSEIIHISNQNPNFSDTGSRTSKAIATEVVRIFTAKGYPLHEQDISGQSVGKVFEQLTKDFLQKAFTYLIHLRPGNWVFDTNQSITQFEQYAHLAELKHILEEYPELKITLGSDYLIRPDIIIARQPLEDEEINIYSNLVNNTVADLTPVRAINQTVPKPLLHAIISCKWTLRSDRAQNVRTEALNLIRNRKGHTPHIMAVTAEPMPTRIASLAQGISDMDCIYHIALPELRKAVQITQQDESEQLETLERLVNSERLRDIADLPLDLIA